jgi:hypothetical protein
MCAYKLCSVEFKYWGMQTKVERFIHDTALRRVMLRAHRQAWAWQDEWHGLTMADIRELEKETQELLSKKMAVAAGDVEPGEGSNEENSTAKSADLALDTSKPRDKEALSSPSSDCGSMKSCD